DITVAANLPSPVIAAPRAAKERGWLRMVAVARIHPIKNLVEAIGMLAGLDGDVEYDIIGPHENAEYLAECRRAAARLPRSIVVRFPGALDHEEILTRLAGYHLFFLP